MSEQARANILARLRAAPKSPAPALPGWQAPRFGEESVPRFVRLMEALHAEVHDVSETDWPQRLASILSNKGVRKVLYAPAIAEGQKLAADWADRSDAPALMGYVSTIEDIKDAFVRDIDAAITTSLGAIAETGTIVLWPTTDEPRLMSVLPPIHIALVRQSKVADNLADLMAEGGWAKSMPTNLVLVSGPSKTADIEQTLAYGVHGPKELIVLLVKDKD